MYSSRAWSPLMPFFPFHAFHLALPFKSNTPGLAATVEIRKNERQEINKKKQRWEKVARSQIITVFAFATLQIAILPVLLSPKFACLNSAYSSRNSSSVGRFVNVLTFSTDASKRCKFKAEEQHTHYNIFVQLTKANTLLTSTSDILMDILSICWRSNRDLWKINVVRTVRLSNVMREWWMNGVRALER